jgi:hypothetical protein
MLEARASQINLWPSPNGQTLTTYVTIHQTLGEVESLQADSASGEIDFCMQKSTMTTLGR